MMKLKDKVAVITGGSSGIGLATALEFKANGAKVALFARDEQELAAARKQLEPDVSTVSGDVRNIRDLDRVFSETESRFGKIDIVFAGAGIAKFASLPDMTESMFDELCDVHFKGAFFTVQRALPHMRDGGSIILVSSSPAQVQGPPMTSVYNAAKAAVRSLGRIFAAELLPRRIRVNTLSPGLTQTPMLSRDIGLSAAVRDQIAKAFVSKIPAGRLGQASELAKAALFLASDDSAYVIGAELAVDGGLAQL
jgi:NAD(P)-dependent dehydrogenase (short-subunit alcohol dehydrogenase family)